MQGTKEAMIAARKAWSEKQSPDHDFQEDAFEAAVSAFMQVLAGSAGKPKKPAPKADAPSTRTITEHFLALASGHYEGYTMTKGRTGSIARDVICFQPNPNSSILLPLFMSVHEIHDALTDNHGRRLDVEIKI